MTQLVTLYLIALSWWDAAVSSLAARWAARAAELQPTAGARHRLKGKARPFDRADYEWGQAIKAMAARMEGQHAWR